MTSERAVALAQDWVWHSPLICTLVIQSPQTESPSTAILKAAVTDVLVKDLRVPAFVNWSQ